MTSSKMFRVTPVPESRDRKVSFSPDIDESYRHQVVDKIQGLMKEVEVRHRAFQPTRNPQMFPHLKYASHQICDQNPSQGIHLSEEKKMKKEQETEAFDFKRKQELELQAFMKRQKEEATGFHTNHTNQWNDLKERHTQVRNDS